MRIPIGALTLVVGLCCWPALSHCMAIHTLSTSTPDTCRIYSGTREDIRRLEAASGDKFKWEKLLIPFYAVDLPLSMIVDTFALMHTVPCVFKKHRSRKPAKARKKAIR